MYFGRILIAWITNSEPSSRTIVTTSKQVGAPRRAEVEPGVVVLVFYRHRMFHRVLDVLVGDAVLARRRVNLHLGIVLRNHSATSIPRMAATRRSAHLCRLSSPRARTGAC
ncbi:MAG: hypothetical protein ACRDQ2_00975, partial [Gaiellales bacterium]